MAKTHKSFIREILKVIQDSEVISFAGGLPNPKLFPVREFADACQKVLLQDGENVLQYSTTEGYLPLREFIAERYFVKKGLQASPDEILITNGSQQSLDLVGKVFFVDGGGENTLRLNFSNSDEEKIEQGIKRLAKVIKRVLV